MKEPSLSGSSRRFRKCRPGRWMAGVLALLGALGARAEAPIDTLAGLSLEDLLSVPVTGATLTDESFLSVPSAVSIYRRGEIERMGLSTLEELVNFVPGFQSFNMGESGHSAPYSSRGRKTGTTSREVLVLLDGMRVDTTIYGGTAFALPLLSLGNVERAEFIRGPGSALYGSNAFLGVINLVTRRDADLLRAEAGAPRSFDLSLLRQLEAGPVRAQLFLRAFDARGADAEVADTFSRASLETRQRVRGDDLQAHLAWGGTELELVSARREAPGFFILGDITDDALGYETAYHRISLQHTLEWGQGHATTLGLAYREWDEELHSLLVPAGVLEAVSDPPSADAVRAFGRFREQEWTVNVLHDWEAGAFGHLLVGGEWRRPRLREANAYSNFSLEDLLSGTFPVHSATDPIFVSPQLQKGERTVFGLFGQYQRSLGDDLELTAGLRYDHYSGEGSRASPRLSLVYAATDALTLKAIYGEAFRAASFVERYTINNPVLEGNPDLGPETVRSVDLVAIWHFATQAVTVGYFHNQFSDGIVDQEAMGRRTFANAGRGSNAGLELEYQARLSRAWSVRAGWTRFLDEVEQSFREADVLGSLALNFEEGSWNVNLATVYQGERERADGAPAQRVTVPAVVATNLNVRFALEDWVLRFGVMNLFDRANGTPPQSLETRQNIPGRGREWRLGVERTF